MTRLYLAAGLAVTLSLAVWQGVSWLRRDTIRDFMRDAALVAAEKSSADNATKARITREIDNATIDDLRERAAAGGMFFADTD